MRDMDMKRKLLESLSVLIAMSVIISTKGMLFSEGDTVWQANGVVICNAANSQDYPEITGDGTGGVIITWQDFRSGDCDIYAQKINSSGVVQWTANGVVISNAANLQGGPKITNDGTGGAIITWKNGIAGAFEIYARRINSSGVVQWQINGVVICNAANSQEYPEITNDGTGGAVITWCDFRSGIDYDIYAQRVNSLGAVQWTADGVMICNAASSQWYPKIISDGTGGAIITWDDRRSGSSDIYAQRIDSSGVVQWTANGVVICNATNSQDYPKIIGDGTGGAIITWDDYRSGNDDIYAQKIDSSGVVQWTANGAVICNAAWPQQYPEITNDGTGGAIIVWQDYRGANSDIYCQKINSSGAVQWTADGVVICNAASSQWYPEIISSETGGAIITWYDNRSGNDDIYAQKIDSSGVMQWTANGAVICNAVNSQKYPKITNDGTGGAIITWQDTRGVTWDIYAQRTCWPKINTISPDSGYVGTSVVISGSSYGSSQGSSKVYFNGADAGSASTWSSTNITITIPSNATSGNCTVVVNGQVSDTKYFTVWTKIDAINPDSGYVGMIVTITGSGYGSSQGISKVYFNGIDAGTASSWNSTSITINVPTILSSGVLGCTVLVNGQVSNGYNFTLRPKINAISPDSGYIGTSVAITGNGYGSNQGSSKVYFSGVDAGVASSWDSGNMTINVPTMTTAGVLGCTVLVNGQVSNGYNFTLNPKINTMSPDSGYIGTSVTISGNGYGNSQGSSKVYFNNVDAGTASSWDTGNITINVPSNATSGNCTVVVNGQVSDTKNFIVWTKINAISPDSGYVGTSVTIMGNGYGSSQGSSKVYFNGADAGSASSWDSGTITINVPSNATSGNCTVSVNGQVSDTKNFIVWTKINAISPDSGYVGTSVTITGNGYGSSQGSSKIYFNGIDAGIAGSWNSTSITINVPSIIGAGILSCTVLVNGQISNGYNFTLKPKLNATNPDSGYVGTSVTITGSGYGGSQGGSKVYFNGLDAGSAGSWDSTSITINVPSMTSAGSLSCTILVNGQMSNSYSFALKPKINSISPDSGYAGLLVTITGSGYGSSQGGSKVYFNGVDAGSASSWDSTSITLIIPTSATTGNCVVVVNGQNSNSYSFTINFEITSISPASVYVDDNVTITGRGFGSSQDTSFVSFGGVDGVTYSNWTTTSITVKVPANAVSCSVTVSVSGRTTNAQYVTVNPKIEGLSLDSVYVDSTVTVTGTGFGQSQGSNKLYLNDIDVGQLTSWSASSLEFIVPKDAVSGTISVSVNGVLSDSKSITVNPYIAEISPKWGFAESKITLTGTGYGAQQNNSVVTFGDNNVEVESWTNSKIVCKLPKEIQSNSGDISVSVKGVRSNAKNIKIKKNGFAIVANQKTEKEIIPDGSPNKVFIGISEKTFSKPVMIELSAVNESHAKYGKVQNADNSGKNTLKASNNNPAIEIIGWNEDGATTLSESDFGDAVTIKIYYSGVLPELKTRLKICRLDEDAEKWTVEDKSKSSNANCVELGLNHFSVYRVLALSGNNLDDVIAYPNPWKKNEAVERAIKFINVTNECSLQIYDMVGNLVYQEDFKNTGGGIRWNLKNSSGLEVASGYYMYLIKIENGKKKIGKVLIVK